MTVRISYSREIDESDLLRYLPRHVYRQGTPRELLVDCGCQDEADLIVTNMNLLDGVHAKIEERLN